MKSLWCVTPTMDWTNSIVGLMHILPYSIYTYYSRLADLEKGAY